MIYLYVKKSPLGLKYLGVTCKNPYQYKGSGKYWLNHIKKHNFNSTSIITNVIFQTEDLSLIKEKGLFYSNLWNIVKSNDWANLMPESGQQSVLGLRHSEETKEKFRNNKKGNKNLLGFKFSEESKQKMSISHKGFKRSKESNEKLSKTLLGHFVSEETKIKISKSSKGKVSPMKGRKHSLETISKMKNVVRSQVLINNLRKINSKEITQMDLDGNFIKSWVSAIKAAEELHISRTHIINCLKNKILSSGKFKWKYNNE